MYHVKALYNYFVHTFVTILFIIRVYINTEYYLECCLVVLAAFVLFFLPTQTRIRKVDLKLIAM